MCAVIGGWTSKLGFSDQKDKLTMEITQEQKEQIEEIISGMECSKDFKCYKSGFAELCKAKIFQNSEIIECLAERPWSRNFSFHFGNIYFCSCPLRKYIAKKFNM